MRPEKKIKVLIVDDSAVVRKVFSEQLSRDPGIEVIGTAPDPYIARDKIVNLRPDVVTLDIEMPRMDGLTFLKKLMTHFPLPVIIVSSLTLNGSKLALDALAYGAVEVVSKPSGAYSVQDMRIDLAEKIHAAAHSKPRAPGRPDMTPDRKRGAPLGSDIGACQAHVIAIGASTGGTEAIRVVLDRLPADSPGVLVVQHMPAHFTASFAERLDRLCELTVREAKDGDAVASGSALIAPGDRHMLLKKTGGRYHVQIKDGPMVHHQRPSVDVLFKSVADTAAADALGILLTGMGADGAEGLLKMKQAGAGTIAQDEDSCVVFGMPREAIRLGAAGRVLPLEQIADHAVEMIRARSSK